MNRQGGVFEALFSQAVIDDFNEELDSISDNTVKCECTFSDEYEVRMKKLFTVDKRKTTLQSISRWAKRSAAVILIIITAFFGILMTMPKVRAAVYETVITWYSEFTSFTSPGATIDENFDLIPTYIPKGFSLQGEYTNGRSRDYEYYNDNGDFIFFYSDPADASVFVDNEEKIYNIITIDGIEYHTFETTIEDDGNIVVFEKDGSRGTIISNIVTIDELVKMGQSCY